MVSLLARDGGGPMPAMQLLIYPPTDSAGGPALAPALRRGLPADQRRHGHLRAPPTCRRAADATDPRVSILLAPDLTGLPPAYVATAGFDPLRDEGEAYALRMREAGVQVALRRHPGLVHSFANLTAISRTARGAMLEAAGALRMGLALR